MVWIRKKKEKNKTAQLTGISLSFFARLWISASSVWNFAMFTFTAFRSLLSVDKSCPYFISALFKCLSAYFSIFSLQFSNDIFWLLDSVICSKTSFLFSLFLLVVVFSFFLVSLLSYSEYADLQLKISSLVITL